MTREQLDKIRRHARITLELGLIERLVAEGTDVPENPMHIMGCTATVKSLVQEAYEEDIA